MTTNDRLSATALRDVALVSLAVGAQLSSMVSAIMWIWFAGSPTSIGGLIRVLAVKVSLGFALGAIGGVSLALQSVMLSALALIMKKSDISNLGRDLMKRTIVFAALGGVISGIAVGVLPI